MGRAHVHGRIPGRGAGPARRSLSLTIALTSLIMLVEAVGGWWANSLSLVSDAGHMLTDTLALGMALFAVHVASRPATARKTYGYHRIEILAALTNGLVLAIIALGIFWQAWGRLIAPQPIDSALMLGVAAIGLATNLAGIWILSRAGRQINVRSAMMHVASDALSSGGVLAGGFLIAWTAWYRVDAVLSFAIGVVILVGAWRILRETVDILLESTPQGMEVGEVCRAIEAIRGIKGVHDLHVWCITSGMTALSGHVILDSVSLARSDDLLNQIKQMLETRFHIAHTTIQIESETYTEVGEIH